MSSVAGIVFVGVLLGLIASPHETAQVAATGTSRVVQKSGDSTGAIDALILARGSIRQADSALAAARRVISLERQSNPAPQDTLSSALRGERDSLSVLLTTLQTDMERAAESPLPPAFKSLGSSRALVGNQRVRVWMDSLDQVDKLRAPFGALGAGDPIYVALTARVNELGRLIRDAATERRSELRARLAPLLAPPPPLPVATVTRIDTTGFVIAKQNATQQFTNAQHLLDSMRHSNAVIDTVAKRARAVANVGAPPIAMLGSALVISLAVGFTVVFVGELRHPRVAHMREGEAVANVRVLSVLKPSPVLERARRSSDVETPPLIDVTSERYRTLYLHLAATEARVPIITLTGDIPVVVGTVAANIAAVAAYEARNALLVDGDPSTSMIASILHVEPAAGVQDVLAGRRELSTVIITKTIGRDRPLAVLPSGHGDITTAKPEAVREMHDALERMARRYDFIVMAVPINYAMLATNTIVPAPDVIICAQVGVTRIATLRAAVKGLRSAGKLVYGIVLWDDERPRV